jgi:beta-lactamase class A
MSNIFSKKLSLLSTLALCLIVAVGTFAAVKFLDANPSQSSIQPVAIKRDQTSKYARAIRYFDIPSAAERLKPLQNKIQKILTEHNSNGELSDASVYLRNLETGEWTSINDKAVFHPGSLFKVPMLMYYLKASEKDPEILNKKLSLPPNSPILPSHSYVTNSIEPGKEYTIRELLKYMASYSDNRATFLLNNNCDVPTFQKMFEDLGLTKPNVTDTSYAISVKDFSVFMRVLYNCTYLNPTNSDYALSVLSESSFDKGLTGKLPDNIVVARKFGEAVRAGNRELHESGIVYCENKPYLLIVMSKGYDVTALANMISDISESVFKHFCV